MELMADFHDMDEVIVVSPGGKELIVTGMAYDVISRTGKIAITSDWKKNADGKNETLVEKEPKVKYVYRTRKRRKSATSTGTGKRGRPKKEKEGE